jgi:Mrp family chromosome partitioning ATPase
VVAVPSTELGEGKSAVAVGLARALSHRGRAVVVVSGDLRRPIIEHLFDVPEVPGLADYLETSGTDVASLLVGVHDNVLLLPAGWSGRSPTNLLARPHLADAVARLRDLQAVVLVDTPAAGWWWSEALTLAAEADATVLVARSGRSRWRQLANLASALHRERFPVLGVVLMGVERRPRHVRQAADGPTAPATRLRSGALHRPPANCHGNGSGHGSQGDGSRAGRRPPRG